MSVSKKLRFEVFKRDGFACQYCGSTPPNAVLECDHIEPKSKGGADEIDNLVCACFECNNDKSDSLLNNIPASIEEKRALLAEKEKQLQAFNQLKATIRERKRHVVYVVEEVFTDSYPTFEFKTKFRISIENNFVDSLDEEQLLFAIGKACDVCQNPEKACKYFCGICWNLIRRQS